MRLFSILVVVLLASIGGLYVYSGSKLDTLSDKMSEVKTVIAVNSTRLKSVEDQLEKHTEDTMQRLRQENLHTLPGKTR